MPNTNSSIDTKSTAAVPVVDSFTIKRIHKSRNPLQLNFFGCSHGHNALSRTQTVAGDISSRKQREVGKLIILEQDDEAIRLGLGDYYGQHSALTQHAVVLQHLPLRAGDVITLGNHDFLNGADWLAEQLSDHLSERHIVLNNIHYITSDQKLENHVKPNEILVLENNGEQGNCSRLTMII